MSDVEDECEEWVGWLDMPPKRVIRVRAVIRSVEVPIIPIDPDIDARVEAMAREAEARMRRRE